jgi:hypothetical protein
MIRLSCVARSLCGQVPKPGKWPQIFPTKNRVNVPLGTQLLSPSLPQTFPWALPLCQRPRRSVGRRGRSMPPPGYAESHDAVRLPRAVGSRGGETCSRGCWGGEPDSVRQGEFALARPAVAAFLPGLEAVAAVLAVQAEALSALPARPAALPAALPSCPETQPSDCSAISNVYAWSRRHKPPRRGYSGTLARTRLRAR